MADDIEKQPGLNASQNRVKLSQMTSQGQSKTPSQPPSDGSQPTTNTPTEAAAKQSTLNRIDRAAHPARHSLKDFKILAKEDAPQRTEGPELESLSSRPPELPSVPLGETPQSDRRQARRRPAAAAPALKAVTDENRAIGYLGEMLDRRPSSKPYMFAGVMSIVWLGLVAAYAYFELFLAAPVTAVADFAALPWVPATFATALGPIVLFWLVAILSARTEKLHLISQATTEVAVRLAALDRSAEQSVSSLGEAVTAQISIMEKAASSAITRAGSLERIVNEEVSKLDRSYEENERKIKLLIKELSSERGALLNTSHSLKNTLGSVASEMPEVTKGVSAQQRELQETLKQVSDLASSFETTLKPSIQELDGMLSKALTNVMNTLDGHAAAVDDRIRQQSERMASSLQEYTLALGKVLDSRGKVLQDSFDQYQAGIAAAIKDGEHKLELRMSALKEYAEQVGSQFDEQRGVLEQSMRSHRADLEHYSKTFIANVDVQREAFESALVQYGQAVDAKTGEFITRFKDSKHELQEVMSTQQSDIESSISGHAKNLLVLFKTSARALDTRVDGHIQSLGEKLNGWSGDVANQVKDGIKVIEGSINSSKEQIDEVLTNRSGEMLRAMAQNTDRFNSKITEDAERIEQAMSSGVSIIRATSDSITQRSLKAIDGLTEQAGLLRGVSDELVDHISQVAGRFDKHGQAIARSAQAIEEANNKVDSTLQKRNSELRDTINTVASRTEQLEQMLDQHADKLSASLSLAQDKARAISGDLQRNAEDLSQQTVENIGRLKNAAVLESEKALKELRAEFAALSQEVTKQLSLLSSTFVHSSDEVRQKTEQAAQQMDQEQKRLSKLLSDLPLTMEETSAAIRQGLEEQTHVLKTLTGLTGRIRSNEHAGAAAANQLTVGATHTAPEENRKNKKAVDYETLSGMIVQSIARR